MFRNILGASAAVCALLSWQTAALAEPTRQECVASYEKAQEERAANHYIAAIEQAKMCSQPQCDSVIVTECVKLYDALRAEVPTFVLTAKDPDGRDLTDVRVTIDGQLVTSKLEGVPIQLDPGLHELKFEADGLPTRVISQRANVGDKNRLIEAMLGEKKPEPVTAAPAPVMVTPRAPAPPKGVPVVSYVLGGVGVLALGGFTYLRLSGINDYNSLDESCSPRCNEDDVDEIRNKFTLSYVALGVGAAAITSAVVIYAVTRGPDETPVAELSLTPMPVGTGARFTARF